MRTYTFALSLGAHASMIAFVIVAPIFATGDLPEPPRSSTFVLVTTKAPDVPPPAPQPAVAARVSNPSATPVVKPDGITEEPPPAPGSDVGIVDDVVRGLDVIPADSVVGGDVIGPPPPSRVLQTPIRTGGDVKPPQKIHHVAPVYPAIARSARVGGIVILETTIAEDGSVQDVRVIRSIPLLDAAAVDAVRQWRFTPSRLNGQPVRVLMTVTVSFTLN
jgi:protein TonB